MTRSYSLKTAEQLVTDASRYGYEILQVSEGVLAIGHVLLLAPSENFSHFEITEEYRNEWSSAIHIRRFSRISKRIQKLIDNAKEE